ncbi:DUF481 domain-containing protein [Aliikangiella marina]|uniref:DUF481 domain-containing protein n=1 Tax=Aliikangiella marina TaxID=1712262 RepID=A0A545TI39_9GAMM|nr:DUF481 domain-containing protein [Aliikangiella marina]TQV76897.1 DUF481 domain-containing protein [Aliikangiella marina]
MPISLRPLVPISLALFASHPVLADDYFMYSPAESDSTQVDCEKTEEGCKGKWEASVEFGYVAITGNQDSNSLNARFAVSYEVEKWRHEGNIAIVESSTEENISGTVVETKAERLTAQAKSDYKFSKKGYAFGILDYDDTKDSGFEYQASFAAGMGYSFIKDDEHSLDGELGFGSRTSKTEATDLLPSDSNSETITRIAGKYVWKISEHSQFEQKLSTEIGEDNTITKSYSGLSANVMENLALKLSYSIKDQTDVPVGNEETETTTAFTVVYTF